MGERRRFPTTHRAPTGAHGPGRRGQIGGIEVLPFAFLVFVAGTLLIVNAWTVIDAHLAVSAAAREGARVGVESSAEEVVDVVHERSLTVLAAHGHRDVGRTTIEGPDFGGASFVRCSRLAVTVRYEVPAITIPFIGGFGRSFTAESTHSELIDPHRDDVPEGSCA